MVSQRNVETVRRLFERWNAGDRSIPPEELDPAVELESPTSMSSSLSGEFASTTCVRSATR